LLFFFSSRRRHTRFKCDWSSDVCSSDLALSIISLTFPFVFQGNSCNNFSIRFSARYSISHIHLVRSLIQTLWSPFFPHDPSGNRSEERRVGKECMHRL